MLFSVFTVVFFQGSLALSAHFFASALPPLSQQLMSVVGGVLLIATAFVLMEIKKIPVANMLPGLFFPPVVVWIVESVWPGSLITLPVAPAL